jgi:hypothetical protein
MLIGRLPRADAWVVNIMADDSEFSKFIIVSGSIRVAYAIRGVYAGLARFAPLSIAYLVVPRNGGSDDARKASKSFRFNG